MNTMPKKFPSGGDIDSPTFEKKINLDDAVIKPKNKPQYKPSQAIPMGVLCVMFSYLDFEALYKMARVSNKIR